LLRVNRAVGSQQQQKEGGTKDTQGEQTLQIVRKKRDPQFTSISFPILQPIPQLIDRIRRVQAQNNQIFTIFGNFASQLEANEESVVVRHFAPPVYRPQKGTNYGNNGGVDGSEL
jgi:hypothetical protein